MAVNRTYKDGTGEKKEDTSFIRVVVWGKMAEICGEYLTKGRSVLVEGRLKSRTWETPDGQKRSALDVVATSVQFLGAKGDKKAPSAKDQDASGDEAYGEVASINVDDDPETGEIPF